MSERVFVDHDALTGITTSVDVADGKFRIVHTQDVDNHLEYSKALQNEPEYKKNGIKADFMHYAHIPDVVVLKWREEGIDVFNPDHMPAVKRKLRDPEWRHLRTTLGDI